MSQQSDPSELKAVQDADSESDALSDAQKIEDQVSEMIESGIEESQAQPLSEADMAERAANHSKMPDQKLVELANDGDDLAFACLYERYRNWAWALLLRLSANDAQSVRPARTMEMLQEIFLQLLRKFPGFQLNHHFKATLYQLAQQVICEEKKKQIKGEEAENQEESLASKAQTPAAISNAEKEATQLLSLPRMQRETLILRYHDELGFEDIAHATGVPVGTVKSRLFLAVRALKQSGENKESE